MIWNNQLQSTVIPLFRISGQMSIVCAGILFVCLFFESRAVKAETEIFIYYYFPAKMPGGPGRCQEWAPSSGLPGQWQRPTCWNHHLLLAGSWSQEQSSDWNHKLWHGPCPSCSAKPSLYVAFSWLLVRLPTLARCFLHFRTVIFSF